MARLKKPKTHLVDSLDDEKTACGIEVSVIYKTTFKYSVSCKRCLRHVERLERFRMMFRLHGASGLVTNPLHSITKPGL